MKLVCSRLPITFLFVSLLILLSSVRQLSAQYKPDNPQTNGTTIIVDNSNAHLNETMNATEATSQKEKNPDTRSNYLTNVSEDEQDDNADGFTNAIKVYNDQDYIKAFELFSTLAEKGHIDALNNLGTLYQTGQGTSKDYVKAAESYRIAASEGHIDAAINLSTLYRLGIGVQRDLAEAYAWLIVAARHGDSEATTSRDILKELLKPEDIEKSDIAAKGYLDYLATNELPLAWLVPQHLKLQNIPDEYKKYITEQTAILPNANYTTPKPTQIFAALPDYAVPSGFTAIRPQGTQPVSQPTPSIPEDIIIPKGFSAIIPKNDPTLSPSHTNSNNAPQAEQFAIIAPENVNSTVTEFNNDSVLNMTKMTPPTLSTAGKQIFIKPRPLDERQAALEKLDQPDAENSTAKKQNELKRYSSLIMPTIMPATMSTSGETYYRPTILPTHINNAVVIRPRRVIPVKVTPIFTVEISEQLIPFIRSLANAHNVSDEQVVAALKIANPNFFEKDPPLRAINDQEQMIIPPKAEILKAPLTAASFEEDINNNESNKSSNTPHNKQ